MARVCDETGVAAPGDGDLTAEVALRKDLLRLQLASTLMRRSLWQSHDSTRPSGAAALEKLRRLRHTLELGFATLHQVKHDAKALAIREKSLSRVCYRCRRAGQGLHCQRIILQPNASLRTPI